MRIVSLLPSTTEILFAINAGPHVVGVTFECDTPAEARTRRIVSTSAMPPGLSSRQIDAWVSAAQGRGEDLYHLDAGALADLDPDLIVTQDLCAVCAVDVTVVEDALSYLGCRAEVMTIDPHTWSEVLDSVIDLGVRTGYHAAAAEVVTAIERRASEVEERVADRPRPRVALLEWTDPPFTAGHWVPEMITMAGGEPVLGTLGGRSGRIDFADVAHSRPDLIVVAPCGYDRPASEALARELMARDVLPAGVPVHAVDANASWARPGPRLIDGVEELARVLHPDRFVP